MLYRVALLLMFSTVLAGCGSSAASTNASPTSSTTGQSQNHVHSILVAASDPNRIYLGAHYYLYESRDGGRSWRPLSKQMVLSMTFDPAHPTHLYAVSLQQGLISSTDAGVHWHPLAGTPHGSVTGVTYDPMYHMILAYGSGVFGSANGGKTWTHSEKDRSITNMAAGTTGSLYAASGNGLLVSRNGGRTWNPVRSIGSQPVLQVVASKHAAYAVTPVSLVKSTDDGHVWKELNTAPQGIEFLSVSPSNPNIVVAEVSGQGFKGTRDGGLHWYNATTGIHHRNFNASAVQIAPSSPSVFYTGSWGLYFYASRDAGQHWTETSKLSH